MAENGDESAKLWKVNRTIHELVNDRVSPYSALVASDCPSSLFQGFLVSEEEISMDLATFRATYAPHGSLE